MTAQVACYFGDVMLYPWHLLHTLSFSYICKICWNIHDLARKHKCIRNLAFEYPFLSLITLKSLLRVLTNFLASNFRACMLSLLHFWFPVVKKVELVLSGWRSRIIWKIRYIYHLFYIFQKMFPLITLQCT